jgi:serine/threonine protein kinase
MEAAHGRRLGCYDLKHVLGRGASGTVWFAEHATIKTRLAVKVLHPTLSAKEAAVRRFFTQARGVNLIGHENVAKLYDLGATLDGEYYVASEYVDGRPLERKGAASIDEFQPILQQVMDALAAAHEKGLTHGDLKPSNIRVSTEPNRVLTKVLDFGITELWSPESGPESGARSPSNNPFLAPEQILGETSDPRVDIYALGVMMFWLATGRLPFELEPSAGESRSAPKPSEVSPSVPPSYDAMILRSLARDPDARYQTIRDLRAGFELAIAIAKESSAPPTKIDAAREAPKGATQTLDLIGIKRLEASSDKTKRVDFEVQLKIRDLASFRRMYSMDIAHHGMFIATTEALPLQSLIEIVIRGADDQGSAGRFTLLGRIVRRVTALDAQAFGGKEGVAIQLLDLDPNKRSEIERLIYGAPRKYARDRAATRNPKAERVIERFSALGSSPSPYNLLQILPGATAATIRETVHRISRETDPEVLGPMTEDEIDRISEIRERLEKAGSLLLDPRARAAHDGAMGNFLGVAQALAGGLSADDLAILRRQFLATRWEAGPTARALVKEGMAAEYGGRLTEARTKLEQALQLDPLDLETHNLYWALRHKMEHSQNLRI